MLKAYTEVSPQTFNVCLQHYLHDSPHKLHSTKLSERNTPEHSINTTQYTIDTDNRKILQLKKRLSLEIIYIETDPRSMKQ